MSCTISVIIPTRHCPQALTQCLAALIDSGGDRSDWEALVVDNSDDDRKSETASVVQACRHEAVRYVPMPPIGLMAARHRGVEMARAPVISFIDDDSLVIKSWLPGIRAAFLEPEVVLVGGANRPEYEIQPPRWLDYFWQNTEHSRYQGHLSLIDCGDSPCRIPPTLVLGCNYSIRKEVFFKINGSHPDYLPPQWNRCQGDGETALSVKVAALGYQAHYRPECSIRHLVPKARFTREYWGNRAFFTALHGSFTLVRAEHGLGPTEGVPPELLALARSPYRRFRAWVPKTWVGRLKRYFFPRRLPALSEPEEVAGMRQYLKSRADEGWAYHQREVRRDPALKEYVTRPHFMGENARLP
jgi:glycosyltransferase involved in cell wall biosynthesis